MQEDSLNNYRTYYLSLGKKDTPNIQDYFCHFGSVNRSVCRNFIMVHGTFIFFTVNTSEIVLLHFKGIEIFVPPPTQEPGTTATSVFKITY